MIFNKYIVIFFSIVISFILGFIGFYIGKRHVNNIYKMVISNKDERIREMQEVIEQLEKKYKEKNKQLIMSERRYRNLLNKIKEVEEKPIQNPKTEEDAVKILKEMNYGKK